VSDGRIVGARLSRRVFVRGALSTAALPWIACGSDGPVVAGIDAGPAAPSCPPFLTPVDEFFVQLGGRRTVEGWQMPDLDETAGIEIGGLVEQRYTLRLSDLEADVDNHVTVLNTLMCVLGSRGTQIWTGVPLRKVLDRAGVDQARARRVIFSGGDGFQNNLKLDDIYASPDDLFEPLLVFRMGGERLPRELGFPVRLLLNDRFGFKNTKWLTSIQVTDRDEAVGQYQDNGYADDGVITQVPIVESHKVTQDVPAGTIELCGFALSGHAAIDRVEVSLDGGAFEPSRLTPLDELLALHPELGDAAQLDAPERFGFPLRGVWSAWRFELDVDAGAHEVDVRVYDARGNEGDATTLSLTAIG
jgi:hypothetical protein